MKKILKINLAKILCVFLAFTMGINIAIPVYASNITLISYSGDKTPPFIGNVVPHINGDGTYYVGVEAIDKETGIAGLSIDNGKTWSTDNYFYNLKGNIVVLAKDFAGNISEYDADLGSPKVYEENGYIHITGKNNKAIQYVINSGTGRWKDYEGPFKLANNEVAYIFARYPSNTCALTCYEFNPYVGDKDYHI